MKYRFEVLCVISRVYDTDGRIKRGLEEGVWSLSAILLSAERESERRSRVRKSKAAAIRSSSDDERGEARRVWFRVDRGESQCIAPVGATSWLRAFVVTRGRTPVADSAESCTTWEERASEEGTEGGGERGKEGRRNWSLRRGHPTTIPCHRKTQICFAPTSQGSRQV